MSATELVARADRALLFGKQETGRGGTLLFSDLPDWFRPGRFARRRHGAASTAGPPPPVTGWPDAARPAEERLRERTRRLAWANALGARLAACTEPDDVLALAARELGEALGAAASTILAAGPGGRLDHAAGTPPDDAATVAERAVAEDRAVLVTAASGPARLAVPLVVDGATWGAMELRAVKPGGFDQDDLHLATTVAEHTGVALHAAVRLAGLRRELAAARDELVARRRAPTGP